MPTKQLLALYNRIADKPAGPKTFATRAKLVARIEQIAADKDIHLSSSGQPKMPEVAAKRAEPKADVAERPDASDKKSQGKGIGALARAILMDPAGYSHAVVAEMVNAQIDGAATTDKCVRWYANEMRKRGVNVPSRRRARRLTSQLKDSAEQAQAIAFLSASR